MSNNIEGVQQYAELLHEYASVKFAEKGQSVDANMLVKAEPIIDGVYGHYGFDQNAVLDDEAINTVRSGLDMDEVA